ncbi:MAG: methionine--tRNA ligase [Acholeplasmataceae bacterium]|nr:methionine--tRNA ligase [Acholeplasmataceae bacterium]
MNKTYYLTTAIAYASAIPHIGNVYEAILADAIVRFKRLDGYDVFFQTGTDEHGQKIENKAKNNELSPKTYVDHISSEIKRIYRKVNISYDQFVRTTDERHIKSVQAIFKKLYDQGDIYLGEYEGWYSIAEEAFILEKDIIDGKGPNGDVPVWTKEAAYFLKLAPYQERLLKHIEEHPEFIEPESRRNEMIQNFLKEPLPDLSVSRTSFSWGVPVEFDKGHIVYVWIDALSNYITGLNYHPDQENSLEFNKYWPADVHLIGKDILRFHTIYWPIILMALGLELPKQVFGHPWILVNKGKMSKSVGNVMYTDDLVRYFGVDVVRYYVLHEIPFAQDGNITYELLIERNNSDLANTIGNLVNRTIGMAHKYREGLIKKTILTEPYELSLSEKSLELLPLIRKHMDELKVADALEEIVKLARFANKYIDVSEPWVLFKNLEKKAVLEHVLYHLIETIRFIAVALQPFIPDTAINIAKQIGVTDLSFESITKFGNYEEQTLGKASVLFERFDASKKIEEILKDQNE